MPLKMKRERETRSMQLMSGTPWETVTLTTLSRDRRLFPQLLTEARDHALRGQEGKLVIRTAWGIEWKQFGQPRRKRPLHSVVLDTGVSEKIERDVQAFLGRRQWYADRGKCGFLPKSSILKPVPRYTLPAWIPSSRTSRVRKDIVHSGTRRFTGL